MISRKEFVSLYKKYLDGLCTAEEIELLDQYQDEIELENSGWHDKNNDIQEVKDRIWKQLNQSRQVATNTWLYKTTTLRVMKIAAIFLLVSSISLFFIYKNYVHNSAGTIAKRNKVHIAPGSDKAILTLADGSKIILTDAKNGKLVANNGVQISKAKDGMLVYRFGKMKANNKLQSGEFNTVTTPKGGQYQLLLSDGTKVWLNAASSLRFPVSFTDAKRNVKLTGEAYFEVAKNKDKPFVVNANGTNVQVLGTHFNVSAYTDEPTVTTTLLEGSVQLVKGKTTAMLIPGEQGTFNNSQAVFSVKPANIEQVIAWKNGYILFDDTNINTIMKQAARWYDVDVVYEGVFDKSYGGKISKYKDISELLKNLELTGTIHFKVEGRRVTVMQ